MVGGPGRLRHHDGGAGRRRVALWDGCAARTEPAGGRLRFPVRARDVYGLPFEIAADGCRAAKLPDCAISGQRLTENSPLLRAWLLDCGYGGMLWGDETLRSDRIGLEKAAIRILKWMLQAKKL